MGDTRGRANHWNQSVIVEGNNVRIVTHCLVCDTDHVVKLTLDQYKRLVDSRNGQVHIQKALPELDAATRELLITGICPECFSTLL